MRFTVRSAPEVDDMLAQIWFAASDRQGLSSASNQIDEILRRAPLDFGVPIDNYRSLRIDPITVLYQVSEADCVVDILDYVYHG
jgi:hypothetical protein